MTQDDDGLVDVWKRFAESHSDYTLCNPDGSDAEGDPELVGRGGSSVVYRARYKGRLSRAVKLLSPKSSLLREQETASFRASFENEQALLSELTHENLAALVDFAGTDATSGAPAYVATQFIEGVSPIEFAAQTSRTVDDLFAVLVQLLNALAYLHHERVMHCDVKPDNVKIRSRIGSGGFNAVLLDLGGARRIPETVTDSDFSYLVATKEFTAPSLLPYLANKTGNRIPWPVLKGAFPQHDLFGFAAVVESLVDAFPWRGNEREKPLLETVIERTRDARYETADELRDVLLTLSPSSMSTVAAPELETGPAAGGGVSTPFGLVGRAGAVGAVMDHPLVQRLRGVPQLDLLDNVLPGAGHSRFRHSLHSMELARTAVLRMTSDPDLAIDLTARRARRFVVDAFLANVGHYQLAHVFEDLVEDRKRSPEVKSLGLLSGEELVRLLRHEQAPTEGEVGFAWSTSVDHRGRRLRDLLEEHDLVGGDGTLDGPVDALLSGLLSSTIDVAKMAYLLDDSEMTGLRFGRAIDPDGIFSALVRPQEEDWKQGPLVSIRERALSHVENLVLARYWMIQGGYWNRTNRSLQVMTRFLISRLVGGAGFDFERYLAETMHVGPYEAVRWLSDRFDQQEAEALAKGTVRNPMGEWLLSRRVIYSRVLTLSPRSLSTARKGDEVIVNHLNAQTTLQLDAIAEEIRVKLDDQLGTHSLEGDVLIDLPRRRREELGGRVVVYSDDRREVLGDLYTVSPVVNSMKDNFDLYAKRMRVFVHPAMVEQAGNNKTTVRLKILEILRDAYGPARH